MKNTVFLFSAILLLFSCRQTPVSSSEILSIEYGTSFGFCIGYCTKTLSIEKNLMTKRLESRNEEELPKSCSMELETEDLFSSIDLTTFRALPDTIGCPDCADGGTEWIEIKTADGVKRVTFEYQNEPEAVKTFIPDLRENFDKLGDCDN